MISQQEILSIETYLKEERWRDLLQLIQTHSELTHLVLKDGSSLIMKTIEKGSMELIKALLKNKPDLSCKNGRGETLWSCFEKNPRKDVLKTLIEAGALKGSSERDQKERMSLLRKWIWSHQEDLIELLIQCGVRVDEICSKKKEPLWLYALKEEKGALALRLLDEAEKHETSEKRFINEIDEKGRNGLMIALNHHLDDVVDSLIQRGIDVNHLDQNDCGVESFLSGAQNEDECILFFKKILAQGYQLSNDLHKKRNALMTMTIKGKEKVASFLLEEILKKNRNIINEIDQNGQTALIMAANHGKIQIGSQLVKAGADLNIQCKEGYTALMTSCVRGDEALIDVLLDHKAQLDKKCLHRENALMKAVKHEKLGVVKKLIQAGALKLDNGTNKNLERQTVLTLGIKYERTRAVLELINAGVDLEEPFFDLTPLMSSVLMGNIKIMEALLDKKVNIDAVDHNNETALIKAIKNKNEALSIELIKRGADLSIRDRVKGYNAKDWAQFIQEKNVWELIDAIEVRQHLKTVSETSKSNEMKENEEGRETTLKEKKRVSCRL